MATKNDGFVVGGILAVLGLVQLFFNRDLQGGFFLLGTGVVIMSSTSKEFRERLLNLFVETFETLVNYLIELFQQ
jgi:hypothetical protein